MAAYADADADAGSATHRVVAGILIRDGKVLMCHRSADRRWYPDVWDFPGGHIEAGESSRGALVRELREELGIAAAPAEPAFERLVASDFDCTLWIVTEWAGTPSLSAHDEHDEHDEHGEDDEHDELAWCSPETLGSRPLADESYVSIIERALDSTGPSR